MSRKKEDLWPLAENLLMLACVQPIIMSSRPRRTSPSMVIPAQSKEAGFAVKHPLSARLHRAPMTSAVLAGWICIGAGLLTIWLPPLCNVFFFVAIILAIIAMATHQIRAGFALLLSALAGVAVCLLLFFVLAAGAAANIVSKFSPHLQTNSGSALLPPSTPSLTIPNSSFAPAAPPRIASNPVTLQDIATMLRVGMGDDEIITGAANKQLVSPIGASEEAYLRDAGAGERLINFLKSSPLYSPPATGTATSLIKPAGPSYQMLESPRPPSPQNLTPAQRDARIAALDAQINALDDEMRAIRTGEGEYKYYNQAWRDQQSNSVDNLRNNLRREKWVLEGR